MALDPTPDLVPVTLAGLLMDDTPDPNGVRWRVLKDGLPGWAAPDVDVAKLAPTGRHGMGRPVGWYRGRPVTVRGRALAPNFDLAWDAYYRILGLTQLGVEVPLVVGEPIPKQLTVELEDTPDASDPTGDDTYGWRVPFQLPMLARYPFKRALSAVTVHVAAGATVSHTAAGTRAAEIEVTVTSPGTVALSIAGLTLRWGSLPAGAVLTSGDGFPHPKRTARSSSGADLFGLIVQPMQWPAIVNGANTLHQAGTAGLDVRYFPTYN